MILSMRPFKERFSYSPYWIGSAVSQTLGIPVVDHPVEERPETVFSLGGQFGYCSWRDEYLDICRTAKRLICLSNDYEIKIPSQLKRLNPEIWTHIHGYGTHFVPWSALNLRPPLLDKQPTRTGLMYYGRMRGHREHLFDKYFRRGDWISTYDHEIEKWPQIFKFASRFESFEDLAAYEWCLYLEDPAVKAGRAINNRFFECLTAGVPLMFSIESVETLRSFGIDPYPIVDTREDIDKLLESGTRAQVIAAQRKTFLERDWRGEVAPAIREAYHLL